MFHHAEFSNIELLIHKKAQKKNSISVVIPALNEADTIGTIVSYISENFVEKTSLIDEIIVMDGNSSDGTSEISLNAGAIVYNIDEVMPKVKSTGKGTALWKSQFVAKGDILLFIDSDILDFDKRFILGLLGPLLIYDSFDFVKAYYKRPLLIGDGKFENYGGRVTEILVKPFLSACMPELTQIIQPLAGEYAIKKEIANKLPFWTGYGVEIGLLIDLFNNFGLSRSAQVDMEDRNHRNRNVLELGKMAFGILQVMLIKFERMGIMTFNKGIGDTLSSLHGQDRELYAFNDEELPPKYIER